MATQKFQEVFAWQKAYPFVPGVYKTATVFPDREQYGLTAAFRSAAIDLKNINFYMLCSI